MQECVGNSVNDADALLANGRDVGTDVTESISAVLGTKSAGNLLFEFDHAYIPLGQIVVEGDAEVIHEGKDFRLVLVQTVQLSSAG